jgi:hypothetical protein
MDRGLLHPWEEEKNLMQTRKGKLVQDEVKMSKIVLDDGAPVGLTERIFQVKSDRLDDVCTMEVGDRVEEVYDVANVRDKKVNMRQCGELREVKTLGCNVRCGIHQIQATL